MDRNVYGIIEHGKHDNDLMCQPLDTTDITATLITGQLTQTSNSIYTFSRNKSQNMPLLQDNALQLHVCMLHAVNILSYS